MRRYRRAPPHRMACLGLLYIQASASTSLTSLRSATSASLRASVSVSRRFSSLSTVSSATDQACSFARRKRGTRVDAVNRPSGYRRTRPRRLSVENPADGSFGSSVLASSRASARRGSFQRDRTSEGEICRVGFERRETRRTAASSSSTTFLRWPAVFVAGRPEALTPPVLPNRVATGATGDAIAWRRMTSAFLPGVLSDS